MALGRLPGEFEGQFHRAVRSSSALTPTFSWLYVSDCRQQLAMSVSESDEAARANRCDVKSEEPVLESHEAVYCELCELWLNGLTQWEDHEISEKHKNKSDFRQ